MQGFRNHVQLHSDGELTGEVPASFWECYAWEICGLCGQIMEAENTDICAGCQQARVSIYGPRTNQDSSESVTQTDPGWQETTRNVQEPMVIQWIRNNGQLGLTINDPFPGDRVLEIAELIPGGAIDTWNSGLRGRTHSGQTISTVDHVITEVNGMSQDAGRMLQIIRGEAEIITITFGTRPPHLQKQLLKESDTSLLLSTWCAWAPFEEKPFL